MLAESDFNYPKVYDRAKDRAEVDSLESNIFTLYYLNRVSFEFRSLLRASYLSVVDRVKALSELPCFVPSQTFQELLYLILTHEMTDRIYTIFQQFSNEVEKQLGRVTVQVYTAVPLTISVQTSLTQKLSQSLGKTVQLRNFIDEKLLGGVMLKLPDGKIYDFTYNKALSDLKYYLTESN